MKVSQKKKKKLQEVIIIILSNLSWDQLFVIHEEVIYKPIFLV